VNRFEKLLSFVLVAALCYSQLVTSAHFVEHLTPHPAFDSPLSKHFALHPNHSVDHRSTLTHLAKHASLHPNEAKHHAHHQASLHSTAAKHDKKTHTDRTNADCSIYHFYSGLNGIALSRADIPFALFNHVTTAVTIVAHRQSNLAHHQPMQFPALRPSEILIVTNMARHN